MGKAALASFYFKQSLESNERLGTASPGVSFAFAFACLWRLCVSRFVRTQTRARAITDFIQYTPEHENQKNYMNTSYILFKHTHTHGRAIMLALTRTHMHSSAPPNSRAASSLADRSPEILYNYGVTLLMLAKPVLAHQVNVGTAEFV